MELAENLALDHKYDKDLGHSLKDPPENGGYHYMNAKKLNVMDEDDDENLPDYEKYISVDRSSDDPRYAVGFSRAKMEANKYFSGIPVNTNMSVVHVPTNVFDGDPKVANAIKWSKGLDRIFKDNYDRDPSLSWQYFGSSTGFMRQYPAMKWRTSEHDPDLYDARMRDWYLKAAASPKEIVILLDASGSMTGLRKEIAKHVVLNILETLSEDDFVTIYKFSKHPTPLVPCFTREDGSAELVQATNENIREFQEAVANVETEEIANFTSALTVAFQLLLESHADLQVGANCNQAIMLVTDGLKDKLKSVEQAKEHWKLECQLLQMKLEKFKNNDEDNEKPIEDHVKKTIDDLVSDRLLADSKAAHFYLEGVSLQKKIKYYEKCRRNAMKKLETAEKSINDLKEEARTTSVNYEEQLSMMSEHLANMNDKLTTQTDEIERH